MDFYLYAEGGVLPAQYDYDLETDGVLADSKRQNSRAKGIIMIVVKRGDKLPTAEQKKAISNIKTLNPTWHLKLSIRVTRSASAGLFLPKSEETLAGWGRYSRLKFLEVEICQNERM